MPHCSLWPSLPTSPFTTPRSSAMPSCLTASLSCDAPTKEAASTCGAVHVVSCLAQQPCACRRLGASQVTVLFALHGFRRGPWADPLERKPLLCLNFHRHPPHCPKQTAPCTTARARTRTHLYTLGGAALCRCACFGPGEGEKGGRMGGGDSVGGTNYLHAPADMGRLHADGRGSHTHGNALYTQRYSMPTNLSAHCRLYHSIPIFYEDPAFAHVLALINPRALQPLSTSCCSSSSTSLCSIDGE